MSAVAGLKSAAGWLDGNPYASLFIPPVLFLTHFLLLVWLVSLGFPDHPESSKVTVSLLLVVIFGLPFACFGAMALAVRQAFLLTSRAWPILGFLVNGAYLSVFTLFFLLNLVLRNLT
jgi:hypothetical protein